MLYPDVKRFIEREGLLSDCKKIIVAVSGGPDSIVLLHIMKKVCSAKRVELICAHVNYMLRGKQSDADQKLVESACKNLEVELFTLRLKPRPTENLQDEARNIRRKFFVRLAEKESADAVALAHHKDDQAETVLFHILRGSGMAGISGMKPKSASDELLYLRPLLFAGKNNILSFARKNKIKFRVDRTNLKSSYNRNMLRNKVFPMLAEVNPSFEDALCELAKIASDENDFMSEVAKAVLETSSDFREGDRAQIPRDIFATLPTPLKRRVLIELFRKLSGSAKDLNSDQIEKMIQISTSKNYSSGTYRLPFSCKFERSGNSLKICKVASKCDR
jgi:tRNA(Ile)-lysidine synthase